MHEPAQDRQGWQVRSQVRPPRRLQLTPDPHRVHYRSRWHVRRLQHSRSVFHEAPLQEVSVKMMRLLKLSLYR